VEKGKTHHPGLARRRNTSIFTKRTKTNPPIPPNAHQSRIPANNAIADAVKPAAQSALALTAHPCLTVLAGRTSKVVKQPDRPTLWRWNTVAWFSTRKT
jgi:hypothetical protein